MALPYYLVLKIWELEEDFGITSTLSVNVLKQARESVCVNLVLQELLLKQHLKNLKERKEEKKDNNDNNNAC